MIRVLSSAASAVGKRSREAKSGGAGNGAVSQIQRSAVGSTSARPVRRVTRPGSVDQRELL